jgi:hypothetical protein
LADRGEAALSRRSGPLSFLWLQAAGRVGSALGQIRIATEDLKAIVALDASNGRINEMASGLLARAEPASTAWGAENFRINSQVVPTKEQAENVLASSCRNVPNLPEPIRFVPPPYA